MSVCSLLEQCTFFSKHMAHMPYTAAVLQNRYCSGKDRCVCARYLVSKKLGIQKVPHDLLPDQLDDGRKYKLVDIDAESDTAQIKGPELAAAPFA